MQYSFHCLPRTRGPIWSISSVLNQDHEQCVNTERNGSWWLYGVDSEMEELIQGGLCSWCSARHLMELPKASFSVMPPLGEDEMCVPLHPPPYGLHPCGHLHWMPLGNHIPRMKCLYGTFQLSCSQEKIYILLSLFSRSQSFPLLSRRFQIHIHLTPAVTASSHLFTKINFKHTLKNNS